VMDGVDMHSDETLGEKHARDNTHDFSTGGMNVSVVRGVNETKECSEIASAELQRAFNKGTTRDDSSFVYSASVYSLHSEDVESCLADYVPHQALE
jgi:c-di-GMP-binding flagellar brake protein YcgR